MDAVSAFGRGTPAGDALFKLYHKPSKPSTFDEELAARLAVMRRQKEAAAKPVAKPVPKSRTYVNVPKPTGRHSGIDLQNRPPMCGPPRRFLRKQVSQIAADHAAMPDLPRIERKYISDADKQHLQYHMQFEGDIPEDPEDKPKPRPRTPPPPVPEESTAEMFDSVLSEIEERKAFLLEMRQAGQGRRYEARIKQEIAQRVSELRRLDKMMKLEQELAKEEAAARR